MKNNKLTIRAIACCLMLPLSIIDAHAGSWKIGGFVRADYGDGDRYPKAKDENRLGITKAAVSVSAKHENLKGVMVVGTKGPYNGTTDGDMNVKAAFVQVRNLADSGVTISAGLQPLRFGLKPNGFKGDRSIQHSVEYGTGGGLPVAGQAGPSVIATANVGPVNIRGGFFKLNKPTGRALYNNGASINDNYFVQASVKNISGLYGVIGYESVYVNAAENSEAITALGLGWKNKVVDVSVERITIDKSIGNTVDDESYTVLELAVKPTEKTNVYADYSETDQSQVKTYRTGVNYNYSDHAMLTLEYSKDNHENGPDIDSVDLRFTLSF